MQVRLYAASMAVIVLLLSGCGSDPTAPGVQPLEIAADNTVDADNSGHFCLGFYQININRGSCEAEICPMRQAGLHMNVTGILNSTMGISIAGVPSQHIPAQGIFTFDITLKHPFGTMPSLTGFDVKGILMAPGGGSFNGLKIPYTWLLNSDGFSRWWNPTEFTESGMFGYIPGNYANKPPSILTGEINPYKYFADILDATSDVSMLNSVDTDDPLGRGMFSAGASNTRRYRIKFPMDPGPQVRYGYAIDASWAPPTVKPPVNVPNDFPIAANQPEPYLVDLDTASSLFYNSETGNSGGVLRLKTTVRDWQGLVSGYTTAQVSSMRAYIPAYLDNPAEFDPGVDYWDSAEYEVDLTGEIWPMFAWPLEVVVEAVSASGGSYGQGLGHPAPADTIAAWNATLVNVVDPPCVADSNVDFLSAPEMGLKDYEVEYLCIGTDDHDFYKVWIPHNEKCTGGRIYANGSIEQFTLILFNEDYYPIASANYGQDLEIDLAPLELSSGTYYVSVNSEGIDEETTAYFLETDVETEPVGTLSPVDISTGLLDLEVKWSEMEGGYFYMTGDAGIWVYSVSDWDNPVPVWRSYEKVWGDPAFYWPYMYFLDVGAESKLHMIDFTDPSEPVNHGVILTFAESNDLITMSDTDLYLYEKETSNLYVWNYSDDPTSIEWVSTFHAGYGVKKIRCIAPLADYVSVLMMSEDFFTMYNVGDPQNIQQKGFELLLDSVNIDFDIYNETFYKINKTPISDEFRTYQINPGVYTMGTKGKVNLPEEPGRVAAYWPKCYVSGADSHNLYSISISDPANPSVANTKDVQVTISAMDARSGELCAASKFSGIRVYELPSDGIPLFQSSTRAFNNPVVGTIFDDIGYFADENDEFTNLTVVDFSDPAHPEIMQQFKYDYPINEITARSNTVHVLVGGNYFIDAYQRYNTGMLNYIQTKAFMNDPICGVVHNARLYVGFAGGGLMKVYDASSANSFNEWGSVAVQTPIQDLIAHGKTLYGISDSLVTVYDVTDPYNPVEQPSYDASGYELKSLADRDNYLYCSTSTDLLVFNIADPLNPVYLGAQEIPNPPDIKSMTLDTTNLFSCNGVKHPYVTDITDPGSPTGALEPFSPDPLTLINQVIGYEGYLFELTDGAGVRVWDLYP